MPNDMIPAIAQHANFNLVPFEQVERMAAAIAKSGLFGMKSTEQALALMLTAQAEGQHPATITQDYDIIQGRASRKTNSVLARYQQAGGSVEWHELTDKIADATFTPPPRAGKALRLQWSLEMAKAAKLVGKDNWATYPRAMLRARCIAEGVRATYPAAIGGMLVSEEAQDLPPIDVTPQPVPQPSVAQPQAKPAAKAPIEGEAKREPEPQRHEAEGAGDHATAAGDDKPITEGQLRIIRAKLKHAALTDADLIAKFGAIDGLKFSHFQDIQDWIVERASKNG